MKRDNLYYKLLIELSDGLISVQDKSDDPAFRGGIYCRACKNIHGRCPDAVFPFVEAYKLTGDKKYLEAAESAFDYGENLMCLDGGLYNDAQTTWRYTTTFQVIAVIEAYEAGKDVLPGAFKAKMRDRIEKSSKWVYENIDEKTGANINYSTTTGLTLALAGRFLNNAEYTAKAKKLVYYAMEHISENGFLFGESKPHDKRSAHGLVGVDLGYNVEESVPAMVKYAYIAGDEELKNRLQKMLENQLDFMLPDGAWDNTFGTRNNKWTYYGSRTSDGCQPAYLLMADRNKMFKEAALRNLECIDKCTIDGFLYGGVHYKRHGEYPCTHHAFEHLNAIAFALENIDEKFLKFDRVALPCDKAEGLKYYKEIDTVKIAKGDYLATITNYDFDIFFSGHASGGTLTALYNRKTNEPMIMASVTDYVLVEPTNMQQVKDIARHRSLTPRFIVERNGKIYHSSYYGDGGMTYDEKTLEVTAKTGVTSKGEKAYEAGDTLEDVKPTIKYTLTDKGMTIEIENAEGTKFVLPLINGKAEIAVGAVAKEEEIFFLTGGFIANEITILPEKGQIKMLLV